MHVIKLTNHSEIIALKHFKLKEPCATDFIR